MRTELEDPVINDTITDQCLTNVSIGRVTTERYKSVLKWTKTANRRPFVD